MQQVVGQSYPSRPAARQFVSGFLHICTWTSRFARSAAVAEPRCSRLGLALATSGADEEDASGDEEHAGDRRKLAGFTTGERKHVHS